MFILNNRVYTAKNFKRKNIKCWRTKYLSDRLRPIVADYDRLQIEDKKILIYLLDNEKITKKTLNLTGYSETKNKRDT